MPSRRRPSEAPSLQSLLEVAPSPMDESPLPSPTSTPARAPTLPNLAPTTRLISILALTHRYSTYPLAGFLGLHLLSTGLTPLLTRSIDTSNSVLLLTREVYQSSPSIEIALIPVTISLHLISGLGLRTARYIHDRKRYGRGKFWSGVSRQTLAGYALVPLVLGHSVVNRVLPLVMEGGSSGIGVDFVGHGFTLGGQWGYWGSWAWYAGLVGLGGYHFVYGMAKFLRIRRSERVAKWLKVSVVGVVSAWLGGLVVVVKAGRAGGIVGRQYDKLYNSLYGGLAGGLLH